MEKVKIYPAKLAGTVQVPSSKSMGHREIICAGLAGGTSIVIATHDLGQARRLGKHVIFLLGGKIHEQGPADVCFNTPHTPTFQAFLKGDIV